jgi:protein-L-isoaspartate(D-aspartate) O-methyltransferase
MSSMDTPLSIEELSRRREQMVWAQLRQRGIRDERVLAAMARVPREEFVTPELKRDAYADAPLPIGSGQTISQPFMVATMLEAMQLRPSDRVLEVGTGTGYQAALLGELAVEVWTVERHTELADRARQILQELGYRNVQVVQGDGSLGLPERAPFDKILVAAGAPEAPTSLVAQLVNGGMLGVPIGNRVEQLLHIVRKTEAGIVTSATVPCSFVPLVGAEGWKK